MNKFRLAGWLAVGGLLGAALLAPSGRTRHRSPRLPPGDDVERPGVPGQRRDCGKLDLGPGEVAWHFVLTSPRRTRATSPPPSTRRRDDRRQRRQPGRGPPLLRCARATTRCSTRRPPTSTAATSSSATSARARKRRRERSRSRPRSVQPVETEVVETRRRDQRAVRRRRDREPSRSRPSAFRSRPSRFPSRPRASPSRRSPFRSRPSPGRHPVRRLHVPATHGVPTPTPKGSVEAATGTPDEDVTPPSTDTLTPTNNTAVQRRLAAGAHRPGRPHRLRADPDPGQPQGSPLRDTAPGPAPRDPNP